MTTRISENQTVRAMLSNIRTNRADLERYGQEVSTGLKVRNPGDSTQSGTVSLLQQTLARVEGYYQRIGALETMVAFQDDVLRSTNDILIRAKEIATQAGNESNGSVQRAQMAEEVWQLRDQLVQLANSKYQGRYIFAGADDANQPYREGAYTVPSSGRASAAWRLPTAPAEVALQQIERTVNITDDLHISATIPAAGAFDRAMYALERLGRALEGYTTELAADGVTPTGNGVALTFPDDLGTQTAAIQQALDALDVARNEDVIPFRVELGGRLQRLEMASSLLELNRNNAIDALSVLQEADVTESAMKLTQAQTALQASLTVSLRILNQSILDYL